MTNDIYFFLRKEKIFALRDAKNKNLTRSFLMRAIKHYNEIYFKYYDLYSYDPIVNEELSELKVAISKLKFKINSIDT